ncbi:glycosyltransferase family 2 protein [Candidatus Peregrinibacteria bacterium]|nr:glycosyltransferase family 2 protein [Candidatus Peregrinibacteria bacterium]
MQKPSLSIVMPIFNEERTLRQIIGRVHAACPDAEVIFVNDGSTDGSLAILQELARPASVESGRPQDHVLIKENGGKGSAVRMGYNKASGRYVIVQDADLEYDPEEIPAMLRTAEESDLPAMFGSRRIIDQHQYAHIKFYIGGVILTGIFNLLYGTRLTDQPNCYKMVRRDILQSLPLIENDFRLDSELAALLARRGIPIAEYPTSYHPRSVAEGKKITWVDFFRAIGVFMKIRLRSRKNC